MTSPAVHTARLLSVARSVAANGCWWRRTASCHAMHPDHPESWCTECVAAVVIAAIALDEEGTT